jgi:hypothetical protein
MAQMLLFPDPRPLVERLGLDFFRSAPDSAGIYLMRDRSETVLYVGKAKNLRKRLSSYRVANPDRMPRRFLRLLNTVERIELQTCEDEAAALAAESRLLRTLRPRFNRAGTWPATPRFLAFRLSEVSLDLAVTQQPNPDWHCWGSLGAVAIPLRASLARLLWCAIYPQQGLAGLPEGWFRGCHRDICVIHLQNVAQPRFEELLGCLTELFSGLADGFVDWIRDRTASWTHPFDLTARDADLQEWMDFAEHWRSKKMKLQPN